MTTTESLTKTYKGIDGQERLLPRQTCHKCGQTYGAMMVLSIGCPDCMAETKKRGWMSASDFAAKYRREAIEDGQDPDSCDCGECAECEERKDA